MAATGPLPGTAAGFAPLSPSAASFFASPSASPYDAAAGSPYDAPVSAPPNLEAPAASLQSPYTAARPVPAAHGGVPPALAFILGFIPGVGAICNGQYSKGLIHAVIFGLLVSVTARAHGPLEPLLGIMIAAWVFYMAFEAFHTAVKRRRGVPVEEFSSLLELRGTNSRLPLGAVLLVVVGFILLMETTDIISMELFARYWPALLIALGIYLLYSRTHEPHPRPTAEHDIRRDLEARR